MWQKNNKEKTKKKYKQPNKISKKKKQRMEIMKEADIFFDIANKRDRISEISWHTIPEACSFCFAHILAKWKYPEYRYFENNIAFVKDMEEHSFLDELVNWTENLCIGWVEEGLSSLQIINNLKALKRSTKKAQKNTWKMNKNLYSIVDEE